MHKLLIHLDDNIWGGLKSAAKLRGCSARHIIESLLVDVLHLRGDLNTVYLRLELARDHRTNGSGNKENAK
jgi:hypothetical protein